MKTIRIKQLYRWNGTTAPLVEAFNAVVAFPTIGPVTKMSLYQIGDELHKRIEHAQKAHQALQSTYMADSGPGANPVWVGETDEAKRHSEEAFIRDFNELLETEVEIHPIHLSALQTASDRWWSLVEKGMMNGASRPLDEAINALMPLIHDDISPPAVVEDATEPAQKRAKRKN